MKNRWSVISLAFAAGCFGGLVNALAVWLFGALKITAALGVALRPALNAPFLYQRIVWGGIWGLLLLLPLKKKDVYLRGFLLSLAPTVVQLLVVFPYKLHKGFLGLQLGTLTPLLVILFNAAWGIAAVLWMRYTEGEAE